MILSIAGGIILGLAGFMVLLWLWDAVLRFFGL